MATRGKLVVHGSTVELIFPSSDVGLRSSFSPKEYHDESSPFRVAPYAAL